VAVTGKLAVYFLCFSLVGLIMLAVIFPGFGVPLRGSGAVLMAGTLILAYMACALVLVYLFLSLRMALSAASFFSGTAFAFVGITFPLEGMPALGKAWSSPLPLTHYPHLFCNIFTELNAILRDYGVLISMVGAVVLYAFVYPLPYSNEVLKQVPLSIVDYDRSALSRQLLRMTDTSELLRVVSRDPDMEPARRKIQSGRSSGILLIPDGFEKDVLQGRKTTVSTYVMPPTSWFTGRP